MLLLKYVDDKDIFQKFYARYMAKRLIHATSFSEDHEIELMGRLRLICGNEYTQKLQRMMSDYQVRGELNTDFRVFESLNGSSERGDRGVFEVLVLTASAWPVNAMNSKVIVGKAFEKRVNAFEVFYGKRHTGRKLNWVNNLCAGFFLILY